MKKKSIVALIIIAVSSSSSANADFIRFGNPYGMNNWYENQMFMPNSMNSYMTPSFTNSNYTDPSYKYTNPYDTFSDNPLLSLFKKNSNDRYVDKEIKDSDIEYLLSKMEKNRFGTSYSNFDVENRLDRLDSQVFGAIQTGNYKTRINRLKHAFSAESTRAYKNKSYNPKRNRFRDMFSSGSPTSIPASEDYYSSLENSYRSW